MYFLMSKRLYKGIKKKNFNGVLCTFCQMIDWYFLLSKNCDIHCTSINVQIKNEKSEKFFLVMRFLKYILIV